MITLGFAFNMRPNARVAAYLVFGLGAGAFTPLAQSATRTVTSVVRTDAHTGKLVRQTVSVPTASAHLTAQPQQIKDIVEAAAAQNEVEAPLVYSVIRAESNYNPVAVSNKARRG